MASPLPGVVMLSTGAPETGVAVAVTEGDTTTDGGRAETVFALTVGGATTLGAASGTVGTTDDRMGSSSPVGAAAPASQTLPAPAATAAAGAIIQHTGSTPAAFHVAVI